MAYVAVDLDGTEHVFQNKPKRYGSKLMELPKEYFCGYQQTDNDNMDIIHFEWKDESASEDTFDIKDIEDRNIIKTITLNKLKDCYGWEDIVRKDLLKFNCSDIEIPEGTIEKILNKQLKWEDEPIELE